ncbi:MAG: hypothetical protein LDLANPLL_02774 [Turneriella sp.]|nr:hypothetical protein [Turneriella sp.]
MKRLLYLFAAFFFPLAAQVFDEVKNNTKLGVAAYNQRRLVDARRFLSTALSIDSTYNPAVLYHGQAFADFLTAELYIHNTEKYIEFEKFQLADAELDEAESYYPTHPKIPILRERIRTSRKEKTRTVLAKLSEKKRKAYNESMEAAKVALDQGKYAEAMHHYSLALKVAPQSVDAQMGYAEAERLLKQDGKEEKIGTLFQQAKKHTEERRFAQAIGSYDRILRIEPKNQEALKGKASLVDLMQQQLTGEERINLAKEYLASGNDAFRRADFAFAIEQYRVGQAMDPRLTDWDALIKKGLAAKKKQDDDLFTDKLKELERRYQAATLQMLLENYALAVENLEAVITIATEFKQEQTKKQAEELLTIAKQALLRQDDEFIKRDSPYYSFVQSLTSLGLNSYKNGDCNAALKHFGAIAEVFPKNRISNQHIMSCTIILHPERKVTTIAELIESIYRIKDTNPFEARRYFDILKFIDPENPQIATLEKELAEKTQVLKKSVKSAEYIDALYRRALLLSQNDPQAALNVLRELLTEDPANGKARALFARIEARLKRQEWAESDRPIAPEALKAYADGIVFYNTGEILLAKAAFARALNLAPNFDRAVVALKKCEAYSKGARF